MLSWRIHTNFLPRSSSNHHHHVCPYRLLKSHPTFTNGGAAAATRSRSSFFCHCTLKFEVKPPPIEALSPNLQSEPPPTEEKQDNDLNDTKTRLKNADDDEEEEEEEDKGKENNISGIQVPREGYITVSKANLLDAIVLTMFRPQQEQQHQEQDQIEEEIRQFLLLSSCLDSILHAEHKSVLEELRIDYHSLTHSMPLDEEETINDHKELDSSEIGNTEPFDYGFNLKSLLLGSSDKDKNAKRYSSISDSRVAITSRFQRAFMQLLYNAQFEELSARDLMLTSALNTDYLLTLPIYVDWKRASESNAIIFRRGYSTERQKGLLIGEKLDYLQSKLLQRIFFIISRPLGKLGIWLNETLKNAFQTQEVQVWTKTVQLWIKELSLFQQSYLYDEKTSDNLVGADKLSDSDLPMWLAAQKAVPRYEGLLNSVGPRERLLRKLFTWTGLITPTPETPFELYNESTATEPYLRPMRLSRMSLSDIWRPATRKYCGNDLWKMLKTSVSLLLSKSTLQEPAFQELILLYTEDMGGEETKDKVEVPSLQLKIYKKIPIPDLPVIFPHKKLSFRIIDTVRLDLATAVGLLAYFVNYKFEDILSSPSAISLDAIAFSALIIYVTRVALGYKQTWDRYQLLVNRTLYEKTLASGFGSVHFLLDASEQQQYKEAILAYVVLLKAEYGQVNCRTSLRDKCERFIYDVFKEKVKMPIDKAMDTLVRLGLVSETSISGRTKIQALPCSKAYKSLEERWNSLLNQP